MRPGSCIFLIGSWCMLHGATIQCDGSANFTRTVQQIIAAGALVCGDTTYTAFNVSSTGLALTAQDIGAIVGVPDAIEFFYGTVQSLGGGSLTKINELANQTSTLTITYTVIRNGLWWRGVTESQGFPLTGTAQLTYSSDRCIAPSNCIATSLTDIPPGHFGTNTHDSDAYNPFAAGNISAIDIATLSGGLSGGTAYFDWRDFNTLVPEPSTVSLVVIALSLTVAFLRPTNALRSRRLTK